MPPRISRSSSSRGPSRPQQRANKKRKQRGLNAFSIASQENPEKVKVTRHRLGEVDDDGPSRKRQRLGNDDEEEDEVNASSAGRSQQRNSGKGRFDEIDHSGGSDSEGHQWRMGDVGEDDDSELDSDEAFGESDEERFEDFTFRGSNSKKAKGPAKQAKNIDLDEGSDDDGEDDEDDFGDEGIDLAQVLDDDDNESEVDGSSASGSDDGDTSLKSAVKKRAQGSGTIDGSSQASSEDTQSDSDEGYSANESDDDQTGKAQMLKDIVASLPQENDGNSDDETETGPQNAQQLLKSLQAMSDLDPSLSQSVKTLARDITKTQEGRKSNRVQVPLPKRQQDRLDRAAAYQKAKETLNRWVDTVKRNRRAEHLTFPLPDPNAQQPRGESRLVSTAEEKPRNELENAIQTILQSSGLQETNGKSEEKRLKAAEELETKHIPLEELMARRSELRKQRDLLFREEKRAKRIKKIKSKAYRRVHRKEKEREAQKERDLLVAAGIEVPEEEQEAMDRRRAEERMGARHKESRWAKGVKNTGRGAWDEEARSGLVEMAQRSEQLKQRISGGNAKDADDSGEDGSDDDSSDSEGENDFRLRDTVEHLKDNRDSEQTSRLGSLKFMQRADAARKQQNEEALKQIQREMDGAEESSDSEERDAPGRQRFGPTPKGIAEHAPKTQRLEFEERDASDSEGEPKTERRDGTEIDFDITTNGQLGTSVKPSNGKHASKALKVSNGQRSLSSHDSRQSGVTVSRSLKSNAPLKTSAAFATEHDAVPSSRQRQFNGSHTGLQHSEETGDDEADSLLPSNLELVQAAFGGDEVEEAFASEKQELMQDEDDKIIDNTLPGWGTWAGTGLSKRDKKWAAEKKKRGQFLTKEAGVKPSDRKDAKLGNRVIISEKQVKKNQKYLAPALPHPFESRQQYERSLRIPIGPEWTTKESFQSATKPRVIVKRGIIKPIQAPLL